MMLTSLARLLALCAFLPACAPSDAQRPMYRCSAEGRAYLSDRPCEGGAGSSPAIGPSGDGRSAMESRYGPAPDVSAVLNHLSPECASLREGVRTGPARGLGSRAMAELVASYWKRCAEEEQVARRRLAEEQQKRREVRDREVATEKVERDRAKLTREQCDEMYRIAYGKRAKLATMTPGERADFDRFEATRQARCGAA